MQDLQMIEHEVQFRTKRALKREGVVVDEENSAGADGTRLDQVAAADQDVNGQQ